MVEFIDPLLEVNCNLHEFRVYTSRCTLMPEWGGRRGPGGGGRGYLLPWTPYGDPEAFIRAASGQYMCKPLGWSKKLFTNTPTFEKKWAKQVFSLTQSVVQNLIILRLLAKRTMTSMKAIFSIFQCTLARS